MVGNRMKKIAIILLAVFILAVSVCACESLETGNSGTSRETCCITSIYETISGSFTSSELIADSITSYCSSIESRISESRYLNLIDIFENKSYAVGNWNLEFSLPAREVDMMQNRQLIVQNNQPVFRRKRPERLLSVPTREEPVRRGIPDRNELNNFMEEQPLQRKNITSNYQTYVTPDSEAVNSYIEENGLHDKYGIYKAALSWTWVSDETLNNAEEKWLTPTEFLEETPDYSSNPVYGEPASDCEEQANCLASLLIASEEYNESTVRVAIGKVDFGDVSDGHAWVEVYEDGEWFPLDPTDGPYYSDESSELMSANASGIDYEKYSSNIYPAVEIWYYYNNEYFIDSGTKIGNAPVSWNKKPESYQKTGKLSKNMIGSKVTFSTLISF
ncbi:transglutaminase-like domain-containing protein [Methanosarcina sp.]|uniref:transglutaminase-like domain-containing protein n=1 Tax=Methanosarcina sp. TaxID=2213 RepID=UPI002AB883FA|nr:transglutaminase-like domain-containing protein [Methanosarcina sp.]MDY9925803.1 transglutaminase-like domain-containing protein [Methanosarcina sp.]